MFVIVTEFDNTEASVIGTFTDEETAEAWKPRVQEKFEKLCGEHHVKHCHVTQIFNVTSVLKIKT